VNLWVGSAVVARVVEGCLVPESGQLRLSKLRMPSHRSHHHTDVGGLCARSHGATGTGSSTGTQPPGTSRAVRDPTGGVRPKAVCLNAQRSRHRGG
jgi:hypothetical protein